MTKTDIHSQAYEFFAFYYGKAFIVPVDNKKTNKQKVYCINRNGEVLFTLPSNCFPWDYSYKTCFVRLKRLKTEL